MQREYVTPWILVTIASRPEGHRRHRYSHSLRLGWAAAWSMARTFLNNRSGETHHTITLLELA